MTGFEVSASGALLRASKTSRSGNQADAASRIRSVDARNGETVREIAKPPLADPAGHL